MKTEHCERCPARADLQNGQLLAAFLAFGKALCPSSKPTAINGKELKKVNKTSV